MDLSLRVVELTHRFASGVTALAGISTEIRAGEFIVLGGANGSGKTVLIKHLNGLLRPTTGEVLLDGLPVGRDLHAARKRIGIVFQNPESQFVGQTVRDDVAFGPQNLRLPNAEIEARVEAALGTVGLLDAGARNPYELSGGQKQKLAIAGILAMGAELIILDEPFNGLDYAGVGAVLAQLVALHRAGHAVLVVTHDLDKVLAHATRLVVMAGGRIVVDGRPADAIDRVEAFGVRRPKGAGTGIETWTWLR